MNVNENGITFRLGVNYDLSGSTALNLDFTKPSGAVLSVPAQAPGTPGGSFAANEYFEYVFADGDVDEAGEWGVRGNYSDLAKYLISDPATFTVNP